LPSDQPGIYRFEIETGMAGKWALNLGAKVQADILRIPGRLGAMFRLGEVRCKGIRSQPTH
jgi:hypothetical protein